MKVHNVEQRSAAWYALRSGKPTASEFSKIITSKGEPSKSAAGYALTLAAELFAGKPLDVWEGNAFTERGRELESAALGLYEFANEVTVEPVGFVTDDQETMGCSPDSLVGTDGMVEIKCLRAENHIKAILYYRKHGYCLPDYIAQTQGQLFISKRRWCDLAFYHPELPFLVIRQEPVIEIHNALEREIALIRKERDDVLSALLDQANGRHHSRGGA